MNGIESEQASERSFGMRNFKYVSTIKEALEKECPLTVSCADIVALSARDGIVMVHLLVTFSLPQSHNQFYKHIYFSETMFDLLKQSIFFFIFRVIKNHRLL